MRVSEDIVPISAFKAQAAQLLKRAARTGQPVVVTQNGKAAGVLLSPAEYDRLTERRAFLEGIERGLADVRAGRTVSQEEAVATLKKRFGLRRL
jgi:prevent-host-death family protein